MLIKLVLGVLAAAAQAELEIDVGDPLPTYLAWTDGRLLEHEVRWVFDSAGVESVEKDGGPLHGVAWTEKEDEGLANLREFTEIWRDHTEFFLDVDMNQRGVLEDATLGIPVGLRTIKQMWPAMESLLTTRKVPKNILLMTGVPPDAPPEQFRTWKITLEYIKQDVVRFLPPGVTLKWAYYPAKGTASISRWLAAKLGKTKYFLYADADDFIGSDALELRVRLLREYGTDLHQVLGGYTDYVSKTFSNFLKVDAEHMKRDRKDMVKAIISDMAYVYRSTRYDVDEAVKTADLKDAKKLINDSFKKVKPLTAGSVLNYPQVQFTPNCTLYFEKVEEIRKQAIMTPEAQEADNEAYDYMQKTCGKGEIPPTYVYYCHNGWGGALTESFVNAMPNPLFFGEDSLVTVVINSFEHASGCFPKYAGGMYVKGNQEILEAIIPHF